MWGCNQTNFCHKCLARNACVFLLATVMKFSYSSLQKYLWESSPSSSLVDPAAKLRMAKVLLPSSSWRSDFQQLFRVSPAEISRDISPEKMAEIYTASVIVIFFIPHILYSLNLSAISNFLEFCFRYSHFSIVLCSCYTWWIQEPKPDKFSFWKNVSISIYM